MSNLIDLYNTSDKLRPLQSRTQIPLGETDFFDREHVHADGFNVGQKKLSPTKFTTEGLDGYNTEKNDLVPPESFSPTEPLHRYTPENPFYDPGQSGE